MSPVVQETSSPVWVCQSFEALTPQRLYGLLQLRSAVFVVEQACVFQDLDGVDPACHHLMALAPALATGPSALPDVEGQGTELGHILAAARLVPPGLKYAEASIGRVVTAPAARGQQLGHELMQRACAEVARLWGAQPIRIGAQAHLQGFYRRHGFVTVGEPYDEDGIDHVEMLRPTADPGDKP